MKRLKLGSWENKPVFLDIETDPLRGHSAVFVGNPGCGKSVLAKEFLARLRVEGYKILIFSPKGNEYWLGKFVNPNSPNFEEPLYGLHLVKECDLGWSPSDFGSTDWSSLNLAPGGSIFLGDLSKAVELHNDDPVKFFDLVNRAPKTARDVIKWNEDFGEFFRLDDHLPEVTVSSMKTRFRHVKHSSLFGASRLDFPKLLHEYGVVVVDLPFFSKDTDLLVVRAHVGMILKQFCDERVLADLGRFVVLIDEADLICGVEKEFYSSQINVIRLIKKFNSFGHCSVFLLSQNLLLIPEDAWGSCKSVFLGNGGFHPSSGVRNLKAIGGGNEKFWLYLVDNVIRGWFSSDHSWMRFPGYDLSKGF